MNRTVSRRRVLGGLGALVIGTGIAAAPLEFASAAERRSTRRAVRIAAADASDQVKAAADFVSSGSGNDEEMLNRVAADLGPESRIILSEGHFEGGMIRHPAECWIFGAGRDATFWKLANGADTAGWSGARPNLAQMELADISFDWNGENQSSNTHGLRGEGILGLWVSRCDFRGARVHNVAARQPATGVNSDWYFRDCRAWDPGRAADADGDNFRLDSGFTVQGQGELHRCEAWGATHHNFHLGARVVARECSAVNGQNSNFNLNGPGATMLGCESLGHGLPLALAPRIAAVHVSPLAVDARVADCLVDGSALLKDAITVKADGVEITRNRILAAGRDGIRVLGSNGVIRGNEIGPVGGFAINDRGIGNTVTWNKAQ